MQGVARNFFTLAIAYAICGMSLGLYMGATHDHGQMPTHAHIMLAGFMLSSVFSFFYHFMPAARNSRLAPVHFWVTALSGIGFFGGLYVLMNGSEAAEPVVAITSMVFFAALLLFAVIALPVIWRSGAVAERTAAGSLQESPTR